MWASITNRDCRNGKMKYMTNVLQKQPDFYPHHVNSVGFFMAKIGRKWVVRQALSAFLLERFGIPLTVLDDYLLFERKKGWFIMRKSEQVKNAAHLKVSRVGLRALSKGGPIF